MPSRKITLRDSNQLLVIIARRAARAYLFGHITHTGPRLIQLLLRIVRGRYDLKAGYQRLAQILQLSLGINQFPAFCGTLLAAYTLLETVFHSSIRKVLRSVQDRGTLEHHVSKRLLLRLSRVAAGLIASSFSFSLLNSRISWRSVQKPKAEKQDARNEKEYNLVLAGRTLDFTLLVSVRAVEALVGEAWRRYRQRTTSSSTEKKVLDSIAYLADPTVFSVSAGIVMWTWFYNPERLPATYQKWISQAASVDERLVQALRNCRGGTFVYGKETEQAPLLEGMCKEYNWPTIWADPAKTIPVPCEMVHMGVGSSCHVHGLSRFVRAFRFSFAMYLPIQLAVKMRRPSIKALVTAVQEAARSAGFLGAFIGFFYYSVCLSRTVLGPKLFHRKTITPQMWDSGLCVGAGCIACGLSIFLENAKRRPELAFFVAPRAVAVFFPRRYDPKYLWREQAAFAASAAVLLAMIEENPRSARGLVAFVLSKILQ